MDELNLQIAATFTAEPVEASLRYLLGKLELPARIAVSPLVRCPLDPVQRLTAKARRFSMQAFSREVVS